MFMHLYIYLYIIFIHVHHPLPYPSIFYHPLPPGAPIAPADAHDFTFYCKSNQDGHQVAGGRNTGVLLKLVLNPKTNPIW